MSGVPLSHVDSNPCSKGVSQSCASKSNCAHVVLVAAQRGRLARDHPRSSPHHDGRRKTINVADKIDYSLHSCDFSDHAAHVTTGWGQQGWLLVSFSLLLARIVLRAANFRNFSRVSQLWFSRVSQLWVRETSGFLTLDHLGRSMGPRRVELRVKNFIANATFSRKNRFVTKS
jgi:hypothetical protein